ncbi:Zinc finger protein [Armadillidium nasatum]|uniref:Zinc finger protein n=1 Tax=Armadillidium nasatum TaxID=96803 RepID=A0A5N5TH20_9CRUS|nr:Zinc finger protein [Armadillidium nasatum]
MQMHSREAHRAEVKPHQCQQCLKSFSSNHQLVQHIRVHTGEKPYKCSYCDRRFKQLSHVQQHTRLHTVIKLSLLYGINSSFFGKRNNSTLKGEEEK